MNLILDHFMSEIPHLRRYARFLSPDRDHADDLVLDCLVRAMATLDDWQRGTNLRGWLFAILRNGYVDELRHRRRASARQDADDPPKAATSGGQEASLQRLGLRQAVNMLSRKHREVLALVVLEGLSYEETADVLEVAPETVRSRLLRTRELLRRWVSDPIAAVPPHGSASLFRAKSGVDTPFSLVPPSCSG